VAFPKYHFCIEDMIAEADKVACRISFTYVPKGATGSGYNAKRRVKLRIMNIFRLVNGKITDEWWTADPSENWWTNFVSR
jgi:predicted ester cyclase